MPYGMSPTRVKRHGMDWRSTYSPAPPRQGAKPRSLTRSTLPISPRARTVRPIRAFPVPSWRAISALPCAVGKAPSMRSWAGSSRPDRQYDHERDNSGRRFGQAAVPRNADDEQTAAAGLRQTDDLLSALGSDADGTARHPDHLEP